MTQTTPRHDDDGDVIDDWREDPWDSSNGAGEVERTSGSGKRATWMVYAAVLLVTGLILAGGVYGWWYIRQAKSTGDPGPITVFVVAEGETLDQVSERLEDEGFISNASFFRSYVDSKGGIETIEPGRYTLRPLSLIHI